MAVAMQLIIPHTAPVIAAVVVHQAAVVLVVGNPHINTLEKPCKKWLW